MANPTKKQSITDISQLYAKAVITVDGCLEWQGHKTRGGYGAVRHNGQSVATHRLVCELEYGSPVNQALALHTCDNPPCINPDHLRWGTYSENVADALSRNRWADKKGTKNGRSKLTEMQVVEMRRLYDEGINTVQLAEQFGVSNQLTSRIIRRKAWSHVA